MDWTEIPLSCPPSQTDQTTSGAAKVGTKISNSVVQNGEPLSPSVLSAINRVNQTAIFRDKYEQLNQLVKGGCGSVFAGYRKEDDIQVVIKRVPQEYLQPQVCLNGTMLPAEVAIMQKLAAENDGSVGMAAPVELLDWYDLENELILVQERPLNAVDLFQYMVDHKGSLQQVETKYIIKQLLDALIALQEREVFHRDIKKENILIVTGASVPKVRLIDFGMSVIGKEDSVYTKFCGTKDYIPPEWYKSLAYTAGPTTVWQVGIVLFEMLHKNESFCTKKFLRRKQTLSCRLSETCKNFLQLCLKTEPKMRPTLTELSLHPWLKGTTFPEEKTEEDADKAPQLSPNSSTAEAL